MAENPRTVPGVRSALSIAISDPTGIGGIQGDLKTFAAMGIYGMAVPVGLAVQNSESVKRTESLDKKLIEDQLAVLCSDMNIHAVKLGEVRHLEALKTVGQFIRRQKLYPLVVAPAFDTEKLEDENRKYLLNRVFPEAALVVLNCDEAAQLLGRTEAINNVAAAKQSAKRLQATGAAHVIVTGLRLDNDHEGDAVDIFYDGDEAKELVSAYRPTRNVGGAGEVFSAAITAALANEKEMTEALEIAKGVVSEAVRQASDLGKGVSPVNHSAVIKTK